MSLVSNTFLLFVLAAVLVYYLVPAKAQWLVLLAFSYLYYISGNAAYLFYILWSTAVVWLFAMIIDRLQKKETEQKKIKAVVILGLLCNLGMLGAVKYAGFIVDNLNAAFKLEIPGMAVILPLGISFYTFQSSGYLLDVYWKKVEAEKNPLKFALFVSFFPQLLQGPIGKFNKLAPQLLSGHSLQMGNITRGLERILWGYAKKMIVADWAGVFADAIWGDLDKFNGIALFGLLFYVTIIGIPFGRMHFRLARLSLSPFGKEVG